VRSIRTAGLAGLWLATACPEPPAPAAEDGPSTRDPERLQAERQANHRAAFDGALEPAAAAMRLADPVAASQIGKGPLRVAPTTLDARQELRRAHAEAERELGDLDPALLEPRQEIGLRAIRLALGRIGDQLGRRPPWRTDAGWTVAEIDRVLDEAEYLVTTGACTDCTAAVASIGPAAAAIARDLSAASPAALAAAIADLRAMPARLDRLAALVPELASAATLPETRAALVAAASELEQVAAALPAGPPLTWRDPPPPVHSSIARGRLPDVIGGHALIHRLEVEEAVSTPPEELVAGLERNLARIAAMREHARTLPGSAGAARPMDVARCEATWTTILAATASHADLADARLDCTAVAAAHAGERLDDAAWTLRLVDLGAIEAPRRAFRGRQQETIALAGGRVSPRAHTHLRRVALLTLIGDGPALQRALDEVQADLCQAAAAVWLHAELGPDERLDAWLRERCGARETAAWRAEALARPRAAMTGLGVGAWTDEPASMVGPDLFWWAPLGLVPVLATPPGQRPGGPVRLDPVGVQVEMQELEP
jgi:hypothetical protein